MHRCYCRRRCRHCCLQLELYRDTRDSILAAATAQPRALRDMAPAARDRAFVLELRAEKNLHPALQTPDGHYKVRGSGGVNGGAAAAALRAHWLLCRRPLAAPPQEPYEP